MRSVYHRRLRTFCRRKFGPRYSNNDRNPAQNYRALKRSAEDSIQKARWHFQVYRPHRRVDRYKLPPPRLYTATVDVRCTIASCRLVPSANDLIIWMNQIEFADTELLTGTDHLEIATSMSEHLDIGGSWPIYKQAIVLPYAVVINGNYVVFHVQEIEAANVKT